MYPYPSPTPFPFPSFYSPQILGPHSLNYSFFGCDSSPISPIVLCGQIKSNLAKKRESNIQKGCKPSEKYQKVKQHGFWLRDHNGPPMNLDNLDLANLVGEVMDEIVEFLNFFELQNIIQKGPYLDLP